MAVVTLDKLSKTYGGREAAVDGVSLRIEHGEFFVLLGPSGCGKSTTLRMIAGLEPISSGRLSIDGRIVNDASAKDRDIAMVFQSYALYPHMTVYENLAFGLRRRSLRKIEIERRVAKVAEGLGLAPFLTRRPHALSGGQRQRVALGRAIVREPKVFLFDEPLSNLDAALRTSTRTELVKLHRELAATMIYVTHDQVEAMTMGDRICIMDRGRVVQVGSPLEVYRRPANTFVARFLGSPPMNLLTGAVRDQSVRLSSALWSVRNPSLTSNRSIVVGIRPEDLTISDHGALSGEVSTIEPLGAETLITVRLDERAGEAVVRAGRNATCHIGERINLAVDATAVHLFDEESGHRIETNSAAPMAA